MRPVIYHQLHIWYSLRSRAPDAIYGLWTPQGYEWHAGGRFARWLGAESYVVTVAMDIGGSHE